jgi:hypothetical protein
MEAHGYSLQDSVHSLADVRYEYSLPVNGDSLPSNSMETHGYSLQDSVHSLADVRYEYSLPVNGDSLSRLVLHCSSELQRKLNRNIQPWESYPKNRYTLYLYCLLSWKKTEHLRSELPDEHTVFLAYVNNPSKVRSIQPSTVANIIKQDTQEACIDTQVHGPHSFRSALSTKAVQLGHKIDNVKKHANWSLSADMFERFYFRPLHQERTSQRITSSVFSFSENSTTTEVEMEATVRLLH